MKRWVFSTNNLIWLLALLIGGAALCQVPPLVAVERQLLSIRAELTPVPESSPVVAVRLKDHELARTQLSRLLASLSGQKVRAVLLHVPLTQPQPAESAAQLRALRAEWERIPGAGHNKFWRRIKPQLRAFERDLDSDAELVKVVRKLGNVVLVSPVRVGPQADSTVAALKKYSLALSVPDWSWQEHLKHFSNPVRPPWSDRAVASVELPWDELLRQAAATGYGPVDGTSIEPGLLLLPAGQRYLPSAPLATLMVGDKASFKSLSFVSRGASSVLLAGKRSYPLDHQLRLMPLPSQMLAQLPLKSADELAVGEGAESELAGKVVVVGRFAHPGAPEFRDALLLSQLLGDFQLSRPGWLPLVELLVLGYFAFFLWLVVPRLPRRTALILMALFLLVWLGGATILLVNLGWWLQLTPPLLLTILGLLLLYFQRSRLQRREEMAEINCRLGEMLQEKGLLDQALERFRACPARHEKSRDLMYNLGLDYERKRRFGHALGVYEQLSRSGRYKDVGERLARLHAHNGSAPLGKPGKDATVMLDQGVVHPTMGRYEIVSELGQGAMGTVYLGRDPKINRKVAIKTLAYGGVDDTQLPMIKERFFREAEAAGRLNHPGIVTIFDAGDEHDLAYLAMEFLDGEDLAGYCKAGTLLEPADVLAIVADVAEALAYAHANDVVHRDIKPANIMRLTDNSIKVTDFGIARVVSNSQTQTGMVLGTPSYMSPEQVAAKKVDGRSDLFSLGSLCYEMLCGEKAFVGDSMASLMYNISNVSYMPLREKRKGLPKCCYDLVDSLLVKAVTRRPKNASEVAAVARACSEKARK